MKLSETEKATDAQVLGNNQWHNKYIRSPNKPSYSSGSVFSWESVAIPLVHHKSTYTRWARPFPYDSFFSEMVSESENNRKIGGTPTLPTLQEGGNCFFFVADQSYEVWSGLRTNWNV
jgi:hypothetical protein